MDATVRWRAGTFAQGAVDVRIARDAVAGSSSTTLRDGPRTGTPVVAMGAAPTVRRPRVVVPATTSAPRPTSAALPPVSRRDIGGGRRIRPVTRSATEVDAARGRT